MKALVIYDDTAELHMTLAVGASWVCTSFIPTMWGAAAISAMQAMQ